MINYIIKRGISSFTGKSILIMSKKTPIPGKERAVKRYYNKLFNAINKSSGLVKIESFGLQGENIQEFVTFTEWNKLEDWDRWKESKNRLDIYNTFKDSINKDKHYILQDLKYNFPLL
jgi:heme-degrading monooxygenase HmoA